MATTETESKANPTEQLRDGAVVDSHEEEDLAASILFGSLSSSRSQDSDSSKDAEESQRMLLMPIDIRGSNSSAKREGVKMEHDAARVAARVAVLETLAKSNRRQSLPLPKKSTMATNIGTIVRRSIPSIATVAALAPQFTPRFQKDPKLLPVKAKAEIVAPQFAPRFRRDPRLLETQRRSSMTAVPNIAPPSSNQNDDTTKAKRRSSTGTAVPLNKSSIPSIATVADVAPQILNNPKLQQQQTKRRSSTELPDWWKQKTAEERRKGQQQTSRRSSWHAEDGIASVPQKASASSARRHSVMFVEYPTQPASVEASVLSSQKGKPLTLPTSVRHCSLVTGSLSESSATGEALSYESSMLPTMIGFLFLVAAVLLDLEGVI